MTNKKILLIGGGGHCSSVLDCLLALDEYDDIGIIEKSGGNCDPVLGIPVIGTDAQLYEFFAAGWTSAFVTLGSIGNPVRRRGIFQDLHRIGFNLPYIIDPSAVVGRCVTIDSGVFIGKRAVINSKAQIGTCAIINTGAVLEHDCTVGDFVHVSPGCTLCGEVSVGQDTHIGAGSVIRQQIRIGRNSLIGAGSVVVKDMPDDCKAYGNPCMVVKKL
jgi:sugar O-acyltransferase (sialic acid O-acetyltransferase NeuD family)